MFTSSLLSAIQFFIVTFSEMILLFVLISMLVVYLQHKLPRHKVQALLSGRSGYFTAALLGAITPFCSCSTLPMMRIGPVTSGRNVFGTPLNVLLLVTMFTGFPLCPWKIPESCQPSRNRLPRNGNS